MSPLTVSRRWYSTSPSSVYLKRWTEQGIHYVGSMGSTGKKMQRSRELIQQIIKVESAMVRKSLAPFVHAVPASAKVVMGFYDAVKGPKPFFKYLRNPFLADSRGQKIPSKDDFGKKPNCLSMSYALTCNILPLESAASWGFVNHFGNESYFPMIDEVAKLNIPESFKVQARSLIREANRLEIGNFLVIGVPKNRLSRWVYDSLPYNHPTGLTVEEVIQNPKVSDGGTLATLIVSKETLDPESGLVMVEASDPDEVNRFCKGMEFENWDFFEKAFEFEGSAEPDPTIKTKVEQLISDFREWQRTGKEPVYEKEEWLVGDMPAALP